MRRSAASLALAAALPLAALLGVAVAAGWMQPGDARLLALLRHAGGDAWRGAAIDLTTLGSAPVLLPLLGAGVGLLLARRDLRGAPALALIVLGGRLLIEIVKDVTARVRPQLDPGLLVHGWSFPSAHAGNSTITLVALVLFLTRGGARTPAVALAALLAFAIGCSRLWLGVHWPSDVAAGWLIGIGWLALTVPIGRPPS